MLYCQARAVVSVGTRGKWLSATGGLVDPSREQDAAEPCFVKTVRGVGYKFDNHGGER